MPPGYRTKILTAFSESNKALARTYSIDLENHKYFNPNAEQNKLHNNIKIFCIGRNKTGTTSLKHEFKRLGFSVGDQREAELIYHNYFLKPSFEDKLINYCKKSDVFQDIPFSINEIIPLIDNAFPNSKFILSVRDDANQWYDSLIKHHSEFFGNNNLPSAKDLSESKYIAEGFMKNHFFRYYGTSEKDPYNKNILINHYEEHNRNVLNYFKNRPNDLLVLNLSDENSYKDLEDFLNIHSPYKNFPWKNRRNV